MKRRGADGEGEGDVLGGLRGPSNLWADAPGPAAGEATDGNGLIMGLE